MEPKEKLIVVKGRCRVAFEGTTVDASPGSNLDLATASGRFEVAGATEDAKIVRVCGRWGDEVGGSGMFSITKALQTWEKGDPVDYPKETMLDSHYHDCDEYWIVYEGSGVVYSEGRHYEVGPGDCLAIGMGHHHDFPSVREDVKAVYFETTMEGSRRRGHLWNHTHGRARPRWDRV
jgi:mannose-6-phosphate isomerase-like protein (cupin superfamily)